MHHFFLPTQIRDLVHIKAWAGAQFESVPIYCSGIEVCEKALEWGARNVSFHQPSWETIERMGDIPDSVVALAKSFDALHSAARTLHLGLDIPTLGWDFLNLVFIIQTTWDLQTAIPPLLEKLPKDGCPVLFDCKNGQDFYFDSGLSRGLIRKLVAQKYKHVQSIDIGPPEIFRQNASSFQLEIPSGSFKVLSHLPTAFYSLRFHENRLRPVRGAGLVDLQSPYFDIPMADTRIGLRACNRQNIPAPLHSYARALENLLTDLYDALDVSGEARACGMFERHKAWALSQYEAYRSLSEASSLLEVERIELTCHDTGLAGPLVSWANQRGIPVEMWPHSEVINVATPVLKNGRKHSFFPRNTFELELGVGRSSWVDAKRRVSNSPKAKGKILILFNQLDSPAYIPRCRVLELKKGLQYFINRLSNSGWQIKIRHKPSHPYYLLLGLSDVEHAEGALSNWRDWPEVCISVASPTTAMIEFWQDGVRCFHVQEIAVNPGEKFILPHEGVTVYQAEPFPILFRRLADVLEENLVSEPDNTTN